MSTIYTWHTENSSDSTGAAADFTLIWDASSGRTKKIKLGNLAWGPTIGFYGVTAVSQRSMTATAITSLTSATISPANVTTVFGFGSSTVAKAYVKRMSQIQADLETLMGKVDSTGLVNIAGVP